MQKATRLISLLACTALMLGTVLTGCTKAPSKPTASAAASSAAAEATASAPPSTAVDTSKAVNLSMYLIGGPAKEYDMVLAELNKKMQADLNASVTVNWIGWGDFSTKYPLVLASGEPIDLIYASTWTNFYQNAQKGAFMAIEDLAPKYAPKSIASYSPEWIKQATVNGHLYAFPANFSQIGEMGYIVRGDLMKKYNVPDIKTIDDFGNYLDAIVKNDKTMIPICSVGATDGLDGYFVRSKYHYRQITQWIWYDMDTGKVVDEMSIPDMPDFYAKMKTWADKGYWPKSVLANKDDKQLQNGTAASRLHNQDTWNGAYMLHPEWDLKFFSTSCYTVSTVAMQDGMAIPASSTNPERALMLLEKLKNDESYYDLLTYGIKGTHFEVTPENRIKPLKIDAFAPEGYCSWGFKNPDFYKPLDGAPANLQQVKDTLKALEIKDPYALFSANYDPIKNEKAALDNVMVQYEAPLTFGFVADPVAGLATLKQKMKEAGIDKVVAELQKQLDAFKAANPQ